MRFHHFHPPSMMTLPCGRCYSEGAQEGRSPSNCEQALSNKYKGEFPPACGDKIEGRLREDSETQI